MKLKLLFPILLFFTTFFRLYGQAADDWHRVVLPEEVPYRIGKVCDFWVCQTNGGYFYKQESDTMWTKVNTDNLPLGGGNSMLWHSNKMGVMLQYDSTTAGGVGADYWRSIFWAFNCDTKKFVQKFDFNCYSVEHSGGIGAGLRSINNDSIWLLTRGEWQYMGGSGLICDAYRSYTGGESWSGVSCSYGTTWHSDTLVSILNDTIWINPAGPQPQAPAMPQPFNGYGAYIAYSDGAILVMRYSTADTAFISYKTTDWGMNWETDTIIFTPPSTVGYFAPQLTTASGCFIFSYGDSEYVHKISGSVWSSLYSEKLGPSNVLWIKSLPFWIRNTKGQLLRSFDYGSTWEEVSTKGLNPALNGSVYYNGEYPIAQVRGLAYKILPDHTIEKLDSFGRSVTQPNLHWEWNDKEWVLVDKTVIYQTPTGWDTLGEFFPMPGIHVFTDEGRRYIVKDKGPVNVLYSDVTGNNWSNTILNGKIHFIPYHNRWFAVTDLKKVYISDDFGSTWIVAQPANWLLAEQFQIYQGDLYATFTIQGGNERMFTRWDDLLSEWIVEGSFQGNTQSSTTMNEAGFSLMQSSTGGAVLTTLDLKARKILSFPFYWWTLINNHPELYIRQRGGSSYHYANGEIYANTFGQGIWYAQVKDLISYKHQMDTTICSMKGLLLADTVLRQSGTYVFSLPSVIGIDSIIALNIDFSITTHVDTTVFFGHKIGGIRAYSDTTFTRHYTSLAGCDSLVVFNVSVLGSKTTGLSLGDNSTTAFIYPNPFSDEVYFQMAEGTTGPVDLSLYDVFGRLQWTYSHIFYENELFKLPDMGNLPFGQYIFVLHSEKDDWQKQITKLSH